MIAIGAIVGSIGRAGYLTRELVVGRVGGMDVARIGGDLRVDR